METLMVKTFWHGFTIGKSTHPYRCFLKLFATWSSDEKKLRLGRFVYAVNGGPSNLGKGYSAKLQFCICLSKPFDFYRYHNEWWVTFLAVKLHHTKSYGGWCC